MIGHLVRTKRADAADVEALGNVHEATLPFE